MVQEQPKVNPDALYQSGDTAKLLGIAASTLHRWTEQGIIRCKIRKCNGRKVYSGQSIINAWRITI